MKTAPPSVLAINGGSSSIRLALYAAAQPGPRLLDAKVERIGSTGTTLAVKDASGQERERRGIEAADHRAAVGCLLDWLEGQPAFPTIQAAGHRVVHGMAHSEPEKVTPALLEELRGLSAYDPDHLPGELELIDAFAERHPQLPQVACFDTAFHRTMPPVARLLAIPRRYQARGVERYGFHGISYSYLLEELGRLGEPAARSGRVILAHLGNGASVCAVRDGRSIDTSMGFTPASGLVMSTRSGDLDPGLVCYLARTEQITPERFQHMVNRESGLLGISETSSDLRDLEASAATDPRAADAVAAFCYQAKKWIGAFAAALGGVDLLVFAGGIGENASAVRARICDGLGFLGILVDTERNAANAPVISPDGAGARVRVLRTDEELMIARSVSRVLGLGAGGERAE